MEWNGYRIESGADLRGAVLVEANLAGANLAGANLEHACLFYRMRTRRFGRQGVSARRIA
jgi:uncharacterized protein YjbI with pentapeptide repeats